MPIIPVQPTTPANQANQANPASVRALPVAANDWPGLAAAVLSTWHDQLHCQAGLRCISQARLCLGAAWAQAGRHDPRLQALARRLARDGAAVEVLVLPGLAQPELRLGWAPWHAPPTASLTATPGQPAGEPRQAKHQPPTHEPPNRTRKPVMKKIPFFTQMFGHTTGPAAQPGVPEEPSLQPLGVQNPPRHGQALSKALAQIADQIAALEVRDLLELDTEGCRFQLWTLTFWITAANQPALRSLVDLNQRDGGVAKALVERGFSKGEGAHLLNTLRLKLEFKRGDSLPRDASEVLIACGRDSVTLPFSYTGQIELGASGAAGQPVAAAGRPAPAVVPGATPPPVAGASLLLWAQLPGQAGVQRWRFTAGPVAVGAADGAAVAVNHHHVSGQHLLLSQDASGQWQVEDRSRNGSGLFDATQDAAERPLPTRQPQPLPAAGALRLGPLPDDPLLSFQIQQPAVQRPAVRDSTAAAPQHRVTQLAAGACVTAIAQPARRVTGLS